MITVKKKNPIFPYDYTYAHIVYDNEDEIGIASKHAGLWQMVHNGSEIPPIYIAPDLRIKNTYQMLSEAVTHSIRLWHRTDDQIRKKMLVTDKFTKSLVGQSRHARAHICKEVIHLPSGNVYKNVSQAAEAQNLVKSTLASYLSNKRHTDIWQYYDRAVHLEVESFNY